MAGRIHEVYEYPPEVEQRVRELRQRIAQEQELAVRRCAPILEELLDINSRFPPKRVFIPEPERDALKSIVADLTKGKPLS